MGSFWAQPRKFSQPTRAKKKRKKEENIHTRLCIKAGKGIIIMFGFANGAMGFSEWLEKRKSVCMAWAR